MECLCVTRTSRLNPSYCRNKLKKKKNPDNTDGTSKNKTMWCEVSLIAVHSRGASEWTINHCARGKRIKQHKREESERQAGVNMLHRHTQALIWVRASKSTCLMLLVLYIKQMRVEHKLSVATSTANRNDRPGALWLYNIHKPPLVLHHQTGTLVRIVFSHLAACKRWRNC